MHDHNQWRNPVDDDWVTTSHSAARQVQRVSGLAILSITAGLLSIPAMCLCFVSVPFSIVAIACGHMARRVVYETNGRYRGFETATFGMLLGYGSLAVTTFVLTLYFVSQPDQVDRPAAADSGGVLLQQAESQLLAPGDERVFGVTTNQHSAARLAQHFIDTLQILDQTQYAETERDKQPVPRNYRAFVQLSDNSVAFLLYVPEYERFTEAAREVMVTSCWQIAQRSVDDILPLGSQAAVALYSDAGRQAIIVGRTASARTDTARRSGSKQDLERYFKLPDIPAPTPQLPDKSGSQIDAATFDERVLPAEAE